MSDHQKQIAKAVAAIKASPFYVTPEYQVDSNLRRLHKNLRTYNIKAEREELGLGQTVARMTPVFQRDNNKWNQAQKVRFVENLISGCRSAITLFSINEGMDDCGILDGLQRLTAVSGFIQGEFPIFEDVFFDQVNVPEVFMNGRITIRIYDFPSLREAVEFYISMNEHITHSPEDIQRARDFLATLADDE